MTDIQDLLIEEARQRAESPEAIDVVVLTDDPEVARKVGPLLAERLYPGRQYGQAIWIEKFNDTYVVTVVDHGTMKGQPQS